MAPRSWPRGRRRQIPAPRRLSTGWLAAPSSCVKGHRFVPCQAPVQVLPTALACAEWLQRSRRETLAGLVFGYEVAARLGAGLTARPVAHQNGQAPLLGAVAAGARVHGLNGDETGLALRLGAVLILTPDYTNAVAGATALNVE